MNEELIKFLKDNRAYSAFKRNVEYQQGRKDAASLIEAFVWENTIEGNEYWNNLESMWWEIRATSQQHETTRGLI